MPTHSGSFRLFRFSGIQVYLHWSWFLVAMFEITSRRGEYTSPVWNVAEYLMLFAIVTLHEFGHALACRQTGGQAREIVLWPLGGIAFVAPPPRPGAELWSIAAGPLVNVLLVPVFWGLGVFGQLRGWADTSPDLMVFLVATAKTNLLLLIFNLLPIYPLDGGQILRALLWFPLGRARSLQVASVLGLIGVVICTALFALMMLGSESSGTGLLLPLIMAAFLGQRCWLGLKEAKALRLLAQLPRHTGYSCPTCRTAPPGGPLWRCGHCQQPFDPFSTGAICPHCQAVQATTPCPHCGTHHAPAAWRTLG